MPTLADLHAAGGDVTGQHGDAWIRMSAVDLDQVRALHDRLGRRVIPGDITGKPVPFMAGGDAAPFDEPLRTPGQRAFVNTCLPLDQPRIDRLRLMVAGSSAERVGQDAGCAGDAIIRALRGEEITPRIRCRIEKAVDAWTPQQRPTLQPTLHQESTMTDTLLDRLNAEISRRGIKPTQLGRDLGMHPTAINTWRRVGKVPTIRQEQVEAWIAGTLGAEAAAHPEPRKPRKAREPVEEKAAPAVSRPVVITGAPIGVVRQVMEALGCEPRKVYVIEGGELVERMGVVL